VYFPGSHIFRLKYAEPLSPASSPDPLRFKVRHGNIVYTGLSTQLANSTTFQVNMNSSGVAGVGPDEASYLPGSGSIIAQTGADQPPFADQPYT